MGRGYSGNHPRFSHKQDERYDAKEAYNKDLTASARLHYLENDRHDHESPANSHCSPMHKHTDAHMKRQAKRIARRTQGDEQDIYYEMKSKKMNDERSGGRIALKKRRYPNDERSGEIRNEMIDEMIDNRPDSPMNRHHRKPTPDNPRPGRDYTESTGGVVRPKIDKRDRKPKSDSPMNACAKSEGGKGCVQQMGGAWRVISNKTDKPWPAKYANKAKAEAALRGYHAG